LNRQWSVEKTAAYFIVKDAKTARRWANSYFEEEPGRLLGGLGVLGQ
jgi:hypothetical protein